jgi:hypothetical protein
MDQCCTNECKEINTKPLKEQKELRRGHKTEHKIFNKGDFSTNATIFIKKYLNLNLTLIFAIGQPKNI